MSQELLVEGLDYMMEDGFLVLSAHYLRRRGSCCGNGCRHCPYTPRHGGAGAQLLDENPGAI